MPKVLNRSNPYNSNTSVKIDRSGPWGNPFIIGVDGDRIEVCQKHKDWLDKWIKEKKEVVIMKFSNKWVIEHLSMLKGQDLVCWCAPSQCHGDYLLWLANKEE